MYILYYDSGTTNTRAYLLKDGKIVRQRSETIGARNSALEKDNTRLIRELYQMYLTLLEEENIGEFQVERIILSGMISSPSGLVEVEHLPTPVDRERLKSAIEPYQENRFFKRTLEIVPGVKTLEQGRKTEPVTAASVNIMRGEEIEIFGILRANPMLSQETVILVLPGSHTHAVLLRDGRIEDIASNVTGELFRAIMKETILGASVTGEEPWEIDEKMVCFGCESVHQYGINRALYMLRILDLFTEASLKERRSYLEGVINAGVLDAAETLTEEEKQSPVRMAVIGDEVQRKVFQALLKEKYMGFELVTVKEEDAMPFSVSGLLALV